MGKIRVATAALAVVCLILAAGALAGWTSAARRGRGGGGLVKEGREGAASLSPTIPPEEEADGDENGAVLAEAHNGNEKEEEWETLGSPIVGLSNESGAVVLFGMTGITFAGGSVSNFTRSGGSLALSDDGHTLVIGESGTDTVRAFVWDNELSDWTRKGQILILKPDPEECESTKYFPECFISFGFNVHLSGDGDTVAVSSPGYRNQTGMVRAYQWEEASSSWTKMGQDIVGDGHRDGLGAGSLKLSQDGRTLGMAASQTINPEFAKSFNLDPYSGPGYLRVFDWREGERGDDVGGGGDDGTWEQRGEDILGLTPDAGIAHLDMTDDGTYIVVGTLHAGYVEVYRWDDEGQNLDANAPSKWSLVGETIYAPIGAGAFFPVLFSSVDGRRIIVSSVYSGDSSTSSADLIYIFEWDDRSEAWERADRLVFLNSTSGGKAGNNGLAVSPDGRVMIAVFSDGAPVFEWTGDTYAQRGRAVTGGLTVALSRDATTMAVGDPYDNTEGFGMGKTTVHRYIPIQRA